LVNLVMLKYFLDFVLKVLRDILALMLY